MTGSSGASATTSCPTACAAASSTGPSAAMTGPSAAPSAWIRVCSGGPRAAKIGPSARKACCSSGAAVVASCCITAKIARSPAWNAGFPLTWARADVTAPSTPTNPPPDAEAAPKMFDTIVNTFLATPPSCFSSPTATLIACVIAPEENALLSASEAFVANPPIPAVIFANTGAAAAPTCTSPLISWAGILVRFASPLFAPPNRSPRVPLFASAFTVPSAWNAIWFREAAAPARPSRSAGRVALAVVANCRSSPSNKLSWTVFLRESSAGFSLISSVTNARAFGDRFFRAAASFSGLPLALNACLTASPTPAMPIFRAPPASPTAARPVAATAAAGAIWTTAAARPAAAGIAVPT